MTKIKKPLSIVIAAVLVVTAAVFSGMLSTKAADIDEENPELEFINIDSDAEAEISGYPLYTADGNLEQSNGKYTINTNSYVPYTYRDDISYAYKTYNVSNEKTDTITYEVTLLSLKATSGELNSNAHAGIMFRSGLNNNSAEINIHLRPGPDGVVALYRPLDGETTSHRYAGTSVALPAVFRMTKTGTSVKMEFKGADMQKFSTFAVSSFPFSAKGPLYAGIFACAAAPNSWVSAQFSDIKVTGKGTYSGGDSSSGSSSGSSSEPAQNLDEDIIPNDPTTVLYETFSRSSVKDGKTVVGSYSWKCEDDGGKILTDLNNGYLYRDFLNNKTMYIGDEKWTDYKLSADIMLSDENNLDYNTTQSTFRLGARCVRNDFYGVSGYFATVKNISEGQVLALYKRTNTTEKSNVDGVLIDKKVLGSVYGDGKWHNVAIRVFDNSIKLYWDNQLIIDYLDDGNSYGTVIGKDVCSQGAIAISTDNCYVSVDNIKVNAIRDEINGSFDNFIGSMWNDKVPESILKQVKTGVSYAGLPAPTAPKVYSSTETTITLVDDGYYDYMMTYSVGTPNETKTEWQDSPTFTVDRLNFQYNFYRRCKITGQVSPILRYIHRK